MVRSPDKIGLQLCQQYFQSEQPSLEALDKHMAK